MKLIVDVAYKSEMDENIEYICGKSIGYAALFTIINWDVKETDSEYRLDVMYIDVLNDLVSDCELELTVHIANKKGEIFVRHIEKDELMDIIERYKIYATGFLHYEVLNLAFVI